MATESKRDDRPKKKKKKKPSNFGLWVGLGIGGLVLLIALIATGVVIAMNRKPAADANKGNPPVAQNPPAPPPPDNQRGAVVKNPKTLLGNIRARGDQIERDAEMVGVVRLYHAYCDEVKNPNVRNLDGFLQSIRSEPAKIVNAVKSKTYLINFKARLDSADIVVYESEKYDRGYFCFRANNQSDYVSAQDLNTAGLVAP